MRLWLSDFYYLAREFGMRTTLWIFTGWRLFK